jgi:zinc protease
MTSRTWACRPGLAVIAAAIAAVAPADVAEPGDYAIVVSAATRSDPAWAAVVAALEAKHRGRGPHVIEWQESMDEAVRPLAASMPRYACFVARPEEAGRDFVAAVHRLARRLDDDPYGDVLWGILTGYDAANALAIASTAEPLVVHRVTAGTELAMDRVVEGEWFCELQRNRMVRKRAGGEAEELRGPDDTTAALAARLSDGVTDLFVTSGHATERDWQIGFGYENGQFRSGGGRLWGLDTSGRRIPIESPNPKVWLPVGNCLAGHIDGPDALALAFMNSCGVRQMIGYTVPTWFGYAGWGLLDTFVEQPGRFTLCEAFHANHHALVHRLETHAAPGDERGLRFDRDVVAFYGDPAWDVRMAAGPLQYRQTLTEADGVFTLEVVPLDGTRSFAPVNTNGSQRGGRPIVQFLPRRLAAVEVVEGGAWKPVVTDTFILVPLPPPDSTDTLRVAVRDRE